MSQKLDDLRRRIAKTRSDNESLLRQRAGNSSSYAAGADQRQMSNGTHKRSRDHIENEGREREGVYMDSTLAEASRFAGKKKKRASLQMEGGLVRSTDAAYTSYERRVGQFVNADVNVDKGVDKGAGAKLAEVQRSMDEKKRTLSRPRKEDARAAANKIYGGPANQKFVGRLDRAYGHVAEPIRTNLERGTALPESLE
eukprot:ANDGO_03727.mRNA.1 hypothetical protein